MKYSKFTLLRLYWFSFKDRGSVLSIALGLGFIAVLVGTIMLTRSFRDQTSVLARQSATESESVAEVGVTRYLDLINNFRGIAPVNGCGNGTSLICTDTATPSWSVVNESKTKSATMGTALANFYNSVVNPPKLFSQTVVANDLPVCNAGTIDPKTISEFTNQSWRNTGQGQGQYRLINYRYTAKDNTKNNQNFGTGTLTVEGRTLQNGQSPTSKVQVTFPVTLQPASGLWIRTDRPRGVTFPTASEKEGPEFRKLNLSDKTVINSDVLDSSCVKDDGSETGSAISQVNQLRKLQTSGKSYFSIPQRAFPPPPKIPTVRKPSDAIYQSQPDFTAGTYVYQADPSNISIKLKGGTLNINAPKDTTVKIYLNGDLDLDEKSKIKVTSGRLILYLSEKSNMVLKDSHLINETDSPENFQIYFLGSNVGPTGVAVQSVIQNSKIENVFFYAPQRTISISQMGISESEIIGTLWALSLKTEGSPKFTQGKEPDWTKIALFMPTESSRTLAPVLEDISIKTIGNMSSWRRCPAGDSDACTP